MTYKYRYILTLVLLLFVGKAVAQVHIVGNVYGGGNQAKVQVHTTVNIGGGRVDGNVYGGGNLGDVGTYTTDGEGYNNWPDDTGDSNVNITGGTIGPNEGTADDNHGNVFGAGKGSGENSFSCDKAMVSSTSVSIINGTVKGNVYGGGEVGRVEHNTVVAIGSGAGVAEGDPTSAPDIKGSVFGGGKGLPTHGYSALVRGNPQVTIEGNAKVGKNVYGGGEIATAGRYKVVDDLPTVQLRGGVCTVLIQGRAIIGSNGVSDYAGHVFGAGKGVEPDYQAEGENKSQKMTGSGQLADFTDEDDYKSFLTTLALATHTSVTIGGNSAVKGSVYGGSENGFVQHNTSVTVQDNSEIGTTNSSYGDIYGGGLGYSGFDAAGRVKGNTTVNVKGGAAHGSVYGGGQLGVVKCNVNVNILGGTVDNDVYGGGALADTNTDDYEQLSGITVGTTVVTGLYTYDKTHNTYTEITTENQTAAANTDYYKKVTGTMVNLLGGTIGGDAYGGGEGSTSVAALEGNTTVNLNGMALDEYSSDFSTYVHAVDVDGDETNDYYMVNTSTKGCSVNRVFGANNVNGTPLGDVMVHVYATQNNGKETIGEKYVLDDVSLDQGTSEENDAYLARLKAILRDKIAIAKAFNDITVSSYNDDFFAGTTASTFKTAIETLTTALDAKAATEAGLTAIHAVRYDVKAVYGGGNEAAYVPTTPNTSTTSTLNGSRSQVIIDGCDYTSIETVYGGGNAAAVPETNVTVNAAYEIYNVFGGGNGKDNLSSGAENPGADVGYNGETEKGTGIPKTQLLGGYIHEAYGGSNQKGRIRGAINLSSGADGTCPFRAGKIVTAGKNADLNGDAIVILNCMPNSKVAQLFGGADNANVNGRVELTIASGNFGQVFGGNNLGGVIKGSIRLNIEETGCLPINIDELYLGGNEAKYSVYHDDNNVPLYITQKEFEETYTTTAARNAHKYSDPVLNVISCTKIGKVFGGGLGTGAALYGNPTVNINMIPGRYASRLNTTTPNAQDLGEVGAKYTKNGQEVDGGVFGGGNEATVYGNTTVNIGTATTVGLVTEPVNLRTNAETPLTPDATSGLYEVPVQGANIVGNVYGGGNLANVTGNTFVNVCAYRNDDPTTTNVIEYTSVTYSGTGYQGVSIKGNVFGGGKGVADKFECDKAMVGVNAAGEQEGYSDGNTSVVIGNGTVGTIENGGLVENTGNVYGGGEIGRVEMNTTVKIGTELGDTSAPDIKGDVFGGGKGDEEHGYAALVRGNPTVTIQRDAKVEHNVYGGGEIASVARYKVPKTDDELTAAHQAGYTNAVMGRPYALKNPNSGFCTVTVRGNAVIGPDYSMKMYHQVNNAIPADDAPDDAGHVFGAGKGILPKNYAYDSNAVGHKPRCRANDESWTWFGDVTEYIAFIQTLALSSQTTVTIDGNAFVKGSVYGGSENGLVQFDTNVNIYGGQIGAGDGVVDSNGKPRRYTNDEWTNSTSLAECAHWDYGKVEGSGTNQKTIYAPYDPYANATGSLDKYPAVGSQAAKSTEGGRKIASDGHTYYGNVFGGGSGSVPYFDTTEGRSVYLNSAGTVKGNTNVTISGGHILTNVYGGCEATNVLGKATITMTDGSIGVPRTLDQIVAHPVTCYLFGAGKGDQRIYFNKDTNVENVEVTISGGTIYGSVFGGGEDGHVLRDVKMTIEEAQGKTTRIGTLGTSYVDGNVFGGGRGFGGDAYTAGNIAGSVKMEIKGGTMLGSVYGGGRLGSVGYGLYESTETETATTHKMYGEMQDDGYGDWYKENNVYVRATDSDFKRGHVDITISGGIIGNTSEYVYPTSAQKAATGELRFTSYDSETNKLIHTKGGNVFAGGMGRRLQLDGTTPIDPDKIVWEKLGNVKSTKLTITGGTIRANVYGGGELGAVTGSHTTTNPTAVGTEIIITGGTIGTEIPDETGGTGKRYYFGSVYGGGMGEIYKDASNNDTFGGGDVLTSNTKVSMSGDNTKVMASVFGGGELAQVGGSTYVTVSGGEIGKNETREDGHVMFGGATMGNVFGGGKGSEQFVKAGLVKTNTNVSITGGKVYHNVYGGGALGSVGTFNLATAENKATYHVDKVGTPVNWTEGTGTTTVNVTGGIIGITGWDNGMVDGASRGAEGDPNTTNVDQLAWVKTSNVTIGTSGTGTASPIIHGSVYGGGENGHNSGNAVVTVHSGTIGTDADATFDNGNVYGAGCGTDKYTGTDSKWHYNPFAGIVRGTTTVTVDGGHVLGSVYGAGSMGSVGTVTSMTEHKGTQSGTVYTEGTGVDEKIYGFGLSWPCEFTYEGTTGLTQVNIKGNAAIDNYVYGAAKGAVDVNENDITNQRYVEALFANVRETQVTIGESGSPTVRSVYGGGEDGHVNGDTYVYIQGGTIQRSVFGGGKGTSTYDTTLWDSNHPGNPKKDTEENPIVEPVHSWTAGKVYGNTHVEMTGGKVLWSIYGGGNLASVGKGNYSGGSDDYSEAGYGELPPKANQALWTNSSTANTYPYYFANSGIAYVNIYGGEVGTNSAIDTENGEEDGFPRGNVFGSSRGVAASSGSLSPRYRYMPDFFLGYVNKTIVTIGDDTHTAPKIYGSVYGGGEDGHVRNSTKVTIHKGEIGRNGDTNPDRGNVFGAGSGTGKYDSDGDETVDACNYSSGSVSCTTQVDIEGSITDTKVYGNVYGGGALASVGPPFTGVQKLNNIPYDEVKTAAGGKLSVSYSKVNVKGGTISGSVYGASRGPSQELLNTVFTATDSINDSDHYYDKKKFATVIWADVNVSGGANITGSVYGGGEKGIVKHATEVNIGTTDATYSGTISESVYGGGKEAMVGGNVTVNMNSGTVNKDVYGGGALANTNINTHELITVVSRNQEVSANATGAKDTAGELEGLTTTVNLLGGTIKGDAYGGGLGRLAKAAVGTQEEEGYQAAVTAVKATVYGNVNVTLGTETDNPKSATAFNITHYTDDSNTTDINESTIVKSGRVFGCNNLNGSPQGNVTVRVWRTVAGTLDGVANSRTTEDPNNTGCAIKDNSVTHKYEVAAVYGGGNLANFAPTATGKKANVIIETCDASIEYVYGGGNAAEVPETDVRVKGAYEIDEVFGGGNGKDPYTIDNGAHWTENPGANIGNASHSGNANTLLTGGYVHAAYGGSNKKGTIYGSVTIDVGTGGDCTLDVAKVVGAGKDADVNGDLIVVMGCKPDAKIPLVYGGADNANVNGNVELTITSGKFGKVFGGNNEGGFILGHIKLNIEETADCDPAVPIEIDELYLGGNQAAYSMYGYYNAGTAQDPDYQPRTAEMHAITDPNAEGYTPAITTISGSAVRNTTLPYDQPELNIISCTRIGKVFGGGFGEGAALYGDPIVNINMIQGTFYNNDEVGVPAVMTAEGLTASENPNKLGIIGDVFGGGNAAAVMGNPTVNIGMSTTVQCHESFDKTARDDTHDGYSYYDSQSVLGAYITGNVFGGGNLAEVSGNTYVNICGTQEPDSESENGYSDTAVSHSGTENFAVSIGNSVYGGGNAADVLGNTFVTMADGYVFNGIFGGGLAGSVGTYTRDESVTVFGHTANHDGCIGKPTECTAGGTCYVVVSGGQIGPIEVATQGMTRLDAAGGPVPQGWVWGGGCGLVEDPTDHPDTHFKAYVNNTDVTIKDNAFILESIIGGGEFGRVLGNTLVKIKGGQIGVGEGMIANGKPVRYTEEQWAAAETAVRAGTASAIEAAALAPCSHFPYGTVVDGKTVYNTYDPYADSYQAAKGSFLYPGGVTDGASDGKTWIGCVFAGGSGYMPVVKAKDANGKVTDYDWISSAGWVEGNSEVRISGGHILTNVYGGNEVTSVGTEGVANTGKCVVKMTGGTIGVPRTRAQIEALPMTGYIFGGGKGDPRAHFDTYTNVGSVEIDVSGGVIYGSVYGGSEDGHVLGNVTVKVKDTTTTTGEGNEAVTTTTASPFIGTWGTSQDGNVFGGGRGFSGENMNAGAVRGNIGVTIEGGKMLGSVYGGGELGSVGTFTVSDDMRTFTWGTSTEWNNTGVCTVNINGGTIGTGIDMNADGSYANGNVFGAGQGRENTFWCEKGIVYKTNVNVTAGTVKGNVYGGGKVGRVETDAVVKIGPDTGTGSPNIFGNVFGGGAGVKTHGYSALVRGNTYVTVQSSAQVGHNVYGGGQIAAVGKYYLNDAGMPYSLVNDALGICNVTVKGDATITGSVFGGGKGKEPENLNFAKPQGVEATNYHTSTYDIDDYMPKRMMNDYAGKNTYWEYYNPPTNTIIWEYFDTKEKYQTFLETLGLTTQSVVSIEGGAQVNGNVYGGSESGFVQHHTSVTIAGGTIGTETAGGNVFGGGLGLATFAEAGRVRGNTTVAISGGTMYGNVYGGGELGDVGTINKTDGNNYKWTDALGAVADPYTYNSTGVCNVTISGATATVKGNVFGAGKGDEITYQCEKAMVYKAIVAIANGTVNGNVYGGGQIGRVENDTKVTIGVSGETGGTPAPVIDGNVFGAGAGKETHGYSALVRGDSEVTIQGTARVKQNVYGGGEKATVGRYWVSVVAADPDDPAPSGMPSGMPYKTKGGGVCTVNVLGNAVIGPDGAATETAGHVFGAGKGVNPNYHYDEDDKEHSSGRMKNGDEWEAFDTKAKYLEFLQTLALVTNTHVTINGNASITSVKGSVYGGSESGFVQDDTDVKIQGGVIGTTTYGDVFGGGRGLVVFAEAGKVKGNAEVAVSGGAITGNVYGGGELGHVGSFSETADGRYVKQKDKNDDDMETGFCEVSITGGKIGLDDNSDTEKGNVFGAGKGRDDTFKCDKAMTMETKVSITAGTVNGNVYGGGEIGRVEYDTEVKIGDGEGTGSTTSTPIIVGSVFGAGRGVATHGYSALVRKDTKVTVEGDAKVEKSVYGGGEIASVGRYGLDDKKMPSILLGLTGYCTVKVQGHAKIGPDGGGNVFGAGKGVDTPYNNTVGDENRSKRMVTYAPNRPTNPHTNGNRGTLWDPYDNPDDPNDDPNNPDFVWEYFTTSDAYSTYLETLALATHPEVTIDGNATVNGSVFGGGELGLTKGSVVVNIKKGTIENDVYGGGKLANTNTTSSIGKLNADGSAQTDAQGEIVLDDDVHPTTTVNLKGGHIKGSAYGGGLGDANTPALVLGDVLVDLNGTTTKTTDSSGTVYGTTPLSDDSQGCIVQQVFGCNNVNGSPKKNVVVHVHATQNADTDTYANISTKPARDTSTYDVQAVYGGGNQAAYDPEDAYSTDEATQKAAHTYVIIDGCGLTSIETVYGGGNAAATPATNVTVNSAYEINEVFAGGNGMSTETFTNPGANVGYKDYHLVENDFNTKELRMGDDFAEYRYGSGIASLNIYGGTIHKVFGGSNTKGNVRQTAVTILDNQNPCSLCMDEAYGGGKNAPMDAEAQLLMACIPGLKAAYGGAQDADIQDDVILTVTNGTFDRVFGGNNISGRIRGTITVNIEETGCKPLIIGELYGGGNQASYSVYGYDSDGKPIESGNSKLYNDPQVNVRSFTSIGSIYGGGYGEGAKMVGDPHVNINVAEGQWKDYVGESAHYQDAGYEYDATGYKGTIKNIDDHVVKIPAHAKGEIGAINEVYGGGNAAKVVGNTYVNVGTLPEVEFESLPLENVMDGENIVYEEDGVTPKKQRQKKAVKGANIIGNVYGGGNAAEVTGNTNVTIGKEKASTTTTP